MSKTTVILASDYEAAIEAAFNLGLGHAWLYPHTPAMVPEQIDRLVYVEGWERSMFQTVGILETIRERTIHAAEIIEQPRTATVLGLDALDAQEALAAQRVRRGIAAPFVEPGTVSLSWRSAPRVPALAWVAIGVAVVVAVTIVIGAVL